MKYDLALVSVTPKYRNYSCFFEYILLSTTQELKSRRAAQSTAATIIIYGPYIMSHRSDFNIFHGSYIKVHS